MRLVCLSAALAVLAGAPALAPAQGAAKKKIVLLAGRPSHGFGAHEHNAGCRLLARALSENVKGIETVVHESGRVADPKVFQDAATVVIYCDGGGGHLANKYLDDYDKLFASGVGLVCIHYAVETPKGKPGDAFLRWMGGYFETNWSVNPHWDARFNELPKHPITRGVRPFVINDEWYYHMRFVEKMAGVTPILTALPPESTLKRPDGPHSGNPFVRAAVLERKEPQHLAWAFDRPGGKGRGFGFTGGHNHWNWAHDDFRKVVLNAIVWTAGLEVPEGGVESKRPTVDEMMIQDEPVPTNFNKESTARRFEEMNRPLTPGK
jgi:type 1 glutamine amidotransferase